MALAHLEKFTDDQRALLISLPCRVGLMVSVSDDSGGDQSVAWEMQALEGIVTGFSEDFLKSEFVEELMRATLAQRGQWEAWSENLEAVPAECAQALEAAQEQLAVKDVLSLRQTLMEIAVAVAVAYRESGEARALPGQVSLYGRYFWDSLLARLTGRKTLSMGDTLNISAAERAALQSLSAVLRIDLSGNPIRQAAA